jgi:hypothetical protein
LASPQAVVDPDGSFQPVDGLANSNVRPSMRNTAANYRNEVRFLRPTGSRATVRRRRS